MKNLSDKFTINTRTKQVHPYYGPHSIGESFDNIGHDLYLVVTPAQAEAYGQVVARQGKLQAVGLDFGRDPALMLAFAHITIGIEPDGYSHS